MFQTLTLEKYVNQYIFMPTYANFNFNLKNLEN